MILLRNVPSICDHYPSKAKRCTLQELTREANSTMGAYNGVAPYIFCSYAHADWPRIEKTITALQRSGCRIWYDEGIEPIDEWADAVANKIAGSEVFLLVLSSSAVLSQNVKREIYYSVSKDKPQLIYPLDDVDLPAGLAMQLGVSQWFRTNEKEAEKIALAINDVLPDRVKGDSTIAVYAFPNSTYLFVTGTNSKQRECYTVQRMDNRTLERVDVIRGEETYEFLPDYQIHSVRFTDSVGFSPDGKPSLEFSVFADCQPIEPNIPHMLFEVDYRIINPDSDAPIATIVGSRRKRRGDTLFDCANIEYNASPRGQLQTPEWPTMPLSYLEYHTFLLGSNIEHNDSGTLNTL